MLKTFTCAAGAQGAVITGMHGIGVRTPIAAAVAEATVGLAIHWHIPKGLMFTIGAKSIMLAIGIFWFVGRIPTTVRGLGAMPKLHWSNAPFVTNFPMIYFLFASFILIFTSVRSPLRGFAVTKTGS